MLIINRRLNEAIILGGSIRVVVIGIEPGRAKLGIDAPPDVVILRDEILDEHSPHYRNPNATRSVPDESV